MSYDIQFLSLADDILVVSASEVEDSSPRAIRLVCDGDVRYTKTVEINGMKTTDFAVASSRTLLVYPGDSFEDTTVAQMALSVISDRWTSSQKVRLVFTPTYTVTKVEGVQKLIQQVIKSVLSNSGSNRFDISEGGNVLRSLGLTLTSDSKAQIATVFSEAASITESQFLAAQSGKKLPPSEKLLSFQLANVSFDPDSQQAVAYLRLVTYAGQAVSVPLVL